ncbi:F-box/kelch-repeat protein [Arabidopsis thaliana]
MSRSAASSVGSITGESPQKKLLQSASSSSSLAILHDEIAVSCFARVPRCYYPAISLVCRNFRRLMASPEIYIERSVIRRTENILYVAIRSEATKTLSWYTLNLKPFGTTEISHRLVPVPSFPSIPGYGTTIISSGSEIYVIGGCIDGELVSTVSVIDCRSHTCRFLPNMKEPRKCAAVGLIDGKLYVVGGCNAPSLSWVEVFNFKKRTWESVLSLDNVDMDEQMNFFVMNDKIYRIGQNTMFVYDPKKGRFEEDLALGRLWFNESCPIDNVLYGFYCMNQILAYDLVVGMGTVFWGLEGLPEGLQSCTGRMVNHGGRLAILFKKSPTEIWRTEIAIERAEEGGYISGKFLWSNHVLTLTDSFIIERALAVTV